MNDCIFCKIIRGELPSTIVYQDEKILAFHDISKDAPVHILVIPKKHIANVMELEAEDAHILEDIYRVIRKIAVETGVDQTGFRVITNCGEDAGQTVHHLHFHIIGGMKLSTNLV